MISEAPAMLTTTDGVALEGRLAMPPGSSAGLVICHPHPLYGGDMDNPVVVRIAEVAVELGLATLRFNFRGVGRSTGVHGNGDAEQFDVTTALSDLRLRLGTPRRVVLAGYSFGAAVSARVARTATLGGLALIAPPLAMTGDQAIASLCPVATPLLIVAGSDDEYCPLSILDQARARLPQASVRVIAGANHFFFGKLFPLGEAVRAWLAGLQLGQADRRGGAG